MAHRKTVLLKGGVQIGQSEMRGFAQGIAAVQARRAKGKVAPDDGGALPQVHEDLVYELMARYGEDEISRIEQVRPEAGPPRRAAPRRVARPRAHRAGRGRARSTTRRRWSWCTSKTSGPAPPYCCPYPCPYCTLPLLTTARPLSPVLPLPPTQNTQRHSSEVRIHTS